MRGKFDLAAFQAALDSHRVAKRLNWKQVSEKTGVSASTLTRMAQGKRPDVDGLAALLAWSGLQAQDFIQGEEDAEAPEPLALITAQLHADKNLSGQNASALEQIIKAAYQQFRNK